MFNRRTATFTESDQNTSDTKPCETVAPEYSAYRKDYDTTEDVKPESSAGNPWNVCDASMERSSRTDLSTWTKSDQNTGSTKSCETVTSGSSAERNNCDNTKDNVRLESSDGYLCNVYDTSMECSSKTDLSTVTEPDQDTSNPKSCEAVAPDCSGEMNDCDTIKDNVTPGIPTDNLCDLYDISMDCSTKSCEAVAPDCAELNDCDATKDSVKPASPTDNLCNIYDISMDCSTKTDLSAVTESDQNKGGTKSFKTIVPDFSSKRRDCDTTEDSVKPESLPSNPLNVCDTSTEGSSRGNLSLCDNGLAVDSSSESENEAIVQTGELRRSMRASRCKRSFKEDSEDDTDEVSMIAYIA